MDIINRLEKLAALVRHDEDARSTCEDAIKEIKQLRGDVGAAAKAAATYGTGFVYIGGNPNTQVKMDSPTLAELIDAWKPGDGSIFFPPLPTRGV